MEVQDNLTQNELNANRSFALFRILRRRFDDLVSSESHSSIINNRTRNTNSDHSTVTLDSIAQLKGEGNDKIFFSYLDEYPDFRMYPLKIDWREVEKGRSFAYEAMSESGYLGAYVYINMNKVEGISLGYSKIALDVLEVYSSNIKDDIKARQKLMRIVESLPALDKIEQLLIEALVSKKEFLLLKVILDCLLHYYSNIDHSSDNLLKVLSVSEYLLDNYLNKSIQIKLKSELSTYNMKMLYRRLNILNNLNSREIIKKKQELFNKGMEKELFLK